jgi:sensor histidine kinase YesM
MYFTMNESLPDQHRTKRSFFRKEGILRFLATPLFAVIIANVTPLVSNRTDPVLDLLVNYTYFTIVSHCLWIGNGLLLRKLRRSNYWINKPVSKTFSILSLHLVLSFFLSFLLFYIWNIAVAAISLPVNKVVVASCIATIISILVTFLYEILLLTVERRGDLFKAEKLGHAKIQAELDTLKSQIDPHFIFNSLNTLSALISDDKEKALLFNENLARVYRYILANRANDLVTVKEEVDFINSYFFLLKIRFEDSLHINMKIDSLNLNRYYLPTIAIQTAIENAIKHNQFSSTRPLSISVELTSDYAIVANNKSPVKYKAASSGVGLINLDNRYKLILNKSIHIDEAPDSFTLYLPIVKK